MEERNPITLDGALAEEIDRRIREALERLRAEQAVPAAAAPAEDPRAAAVDERERRVAERELRASALEQLAARGLPRELADVLPCGDAAQLSRALDALEQAFRSAVQAAVDERLRGRTPTGAGAAKPDPDALSDAEYYRLNAASAARGA